MSRGGRLLFRAAGIAFVVVGTLVFARRGMWIGLAAFVLAGTYLLVLSRSRRPGGVR